MDVPVIAECDATSFLGSPATNQKELIWQMGLGSVIAYYDSFSELRGLISEMSVMKTSTEFKGCLGVFGIKTHAPIVQFPWIPQKCGKRNCIRYSTTFQQFPLSSTSDPKFTDYDSSKRSKIALVCLHCL